MLKWDKTINSKLDGQIPFNPQKRTETKKEQEGIFCSNDNPLCPKPNIDERQLLEAKFEKIKNNKIIYLDSNSNHPIVPEILDRFVHISKNTLNASSSHLLGRKSRIILEEARDNIAKFFKCEDSSKFIFTSGGTESNNIAILGKRKEIKCEKNEIIVSSTEHKSVLNSVMHLKRYGAKVHVLPVNSDGIIQEDVLKSALNSSTALVCIMHSNNETGVIMPIEKYGDIVKKFNKDIHFHVDACQSLSKSSFFEYGNVDSFSISGHKIGAPVGSGLLYMNDIKSIDPIMFGGNQEFAVKPGTYNVPMAVALSDAIKMTERVNLEAMGGLRDYMEECLLSELDCKINGKGSNRIANTSSITINNMNARSLIDSLSDLGFYISGGSACTAFDNSPSHVLLAMGLSPEEAKSTIRVSLNRYISEELIDSFIDAIGSLVRSNIG